MSTDTKPTDNIIHFDFRAAAKARDAKEKESNDNAAAPKKRTRTKKAAVAEAATTSDSTGAPAAAPSKLAAFPSPSSPATATVPPKMTVELDPSEKSEFNRRKAVFFGHVINFGLVSVTFDTRVAGVKVAPSLAGKPEVVLNFSKNFHIADFDYDSVGVRATLSFDEGSTLCDIPWAAVWMIVSRPAVSAYAVPFDAPPERRPTVTGVLRNVRAMLEQLPTQGR